MKKVKSLKKQILQLLILFSISVVIVFGIISISNLYTSKIEIIKHNQNVALRQVTKEVQNLTSDIENIAHYISDNYSSYNSLLKNIVETNKNISSILILIRTKCAPVGPGMGSKIRAGLKRLLNFVETSGRRHYKFSNEWLRVLK